VPVAPPSSGSLPIGGDESLRGPRAFSRAACSATVAGFTAAAVHAARDAAGVNGVVCFPAGTYTGDVTASVAGQRWEFDQGNLSAGSGTVFNGRITVSAPNVRIRGGTKNAGEIWGPRNADYSGLTIQHMFWRGTVRLGLENCRRNLTVTNIDQSGNPNDAFIKVWCDLAGDRTDGGPLVVADSRFVRTATAPNGQPASAIALQDGWGQGRMNEIRVLNNRIYQGTGEGAAGQSGWFGIELFRGDGHEIAYNDLSGGEVLISLPAVSHGHVHHNRLVLGEGSAGRTYHGAEIGGSPEHPGAAYGSTVEYNLGVLAPGTRTTGALVDPNNSPVELTVRNNKVDGVTYLIASGSVGADWMIVANCLLDGAEVTGTFTQSADQPSVIANNGPTACRW
jgi:hypothetical protein